MRLSAQKPRLSQFVAARRHDLPAGRHTTRMQAPARCGCGAVGSCFGPGNDQAGTGRNSRRRVLPMLVFGSGSVRNSISFGTL